MRDRVFHFRTTLVFVSLLLITATSPLLQTTTAEHMNQGAWLTKSEYTENFFLNSGDHITLETRIGANEFASVSVNCSDCSLLLETNSATINSTPSATVYSSTESFLKITIESSVTQLIEMNQLIGVSESIASSRPAPGAPFLPAEIHYCESDYSCLGDTQNAQPRSVLEYELNYSGYQSGVATSDSANHFAVGLLEGETLEYSLAFVDSNAELELFWQNQTNEQYIPIAIFSSGGFIEKGANIEWFTASEDGRLIFKVSTVSPRVIWGIQTIIHQEKSYIIENLNDSTRITGHGEISFSSEISHGQAVIFSSLPENCQISSSEFINGNFTSKQPAVLDKTSLDGVALWAKPSSVLITVTLECLALDTNVNIVSYFDANSTLEAPSLIPMNYFGNNSSYPTTNPITNGIDSYFITSIGDNSDVYKIEIEAWEDSIHFLKYTIESDFAENLSIRAWSFNETGEMLDVQTRNYSNLKLELGIEVPRGTQFFQVFIREDSVQSNEWGGDGNMIQYEIFIDYSEIDEGDEPWFPPSDEAVKWGNIVRWILGFSFLLPFIILMIINAKNKHEAKEFANKKNRLAELKELLKSGDADPVQSLELIEKAMIKLRMIDWEESVSAWGKPDADYLTENVQLCVWNLGKEMAKTENAVALMLGVHILEEDWEVAGIRFDAPQDSAFSVQRVSPKAMYHGEEVFLDSLVKNTRLFMLVELSGEGDYVDVELNGTVNKKATACRIPVTIDVSSEE